MSLHHVAASAAFLCLAVIAKAESPAREHPWPEVSPDESSLPAVVPAELTARFEAAAERWRGLDAGTIRYTVRPGGPTRLTYGWDVGTSFEQAFSWNDGRWRLETLGEVEADGKAILFVNRSDGRGEVYYPTLWKVFPFPPEVFSQPSVASKLPGEGKFTPLAERVRLEGKEYYQFERSSIRETRSRNLTDDIKSLFTAFGASKTSQSEREILRIAADPETFLPVAWAIGVRQETSVDNGPAKLGFLQLPLAAGRFGDFRVLGDTVVPWSLDVTEYELLQSLAYEPASRTEYRIVEWAEASAGEETVLAVPDGAFIQDDGRDVIYSAGMSREEIDRLQAADARRDRYFANLRSEPAAELDGDWVSGDPIKLADLKGRRVRLYFWSIHCLSCYRDLERLQQSYARGEAEGEALITVHGRAEGEELEQVRRFVREKGLTFPVLVERPADDREGPGRLFERYRIYHLSGNVFLDEQGRYAGSDHETMPIALESSLEQKWWGAD